MADERKLNGSPSINKEYYYYYYYLKSWCLGFIIGAINRLKTQIRQ